MLGVRLRNVPEEDRFNYAPSYPAAFREGRAVDSHIYPVVVVLLKHNRLRKNNRTTVNAVNRQ